VEPLSEAKTATPTECHPERSEGSAFARHAWATSEIPRFARDDRICAIGCFWESLNACTVSRPVGRRTWMCGVFRHGMDAVSENPLTLPARGFALSGKAFFFGSFLLTLFKRNEPAEGGSFCSSLQEAEKQKAKWIPAFAGMTAL